MTVMALITAQGYTVEEAAQACQKGRELISTACVKMLRRFE
jgi:hypothetical protein